MKSAVHIVTAGGLVLLLSPAFLRSASPHQASSSTSPPPKHSIGTSQKAKGIPNFGKVAPTLYRGGQPSAAGFASLQKMGVQIVVDMRSGREMSEQKQVEKLGMQYVHIAWHCPFPSDKPFAKFLELLQEKPEKKVFVHCRLGDDRTGMAVAAYRMADQGWSADEAMNEMREF